MENTTQFWTLLWS